MATPIRFSTPHLHSGHEDIRARAHIHAPGQSHSYGHAHTHSHTPPPDNYSAAFLIGIALNITFVIAEALFGLRAHSVSLIADAGHNLSDVLGLLLAWVALLLSRRRPTPRHTYGLRSSSILAALANAIILLLSIGAVAWAAIVRLRHPEPVQGALVAWVAATGILVNTVTALLFLKGRHTDLNIRGAFLHMAADATVSAGVLVSGLIMARTGWFWLDPVISLTIVMIITAGTWNLLRDSLSLALHAVPATIDPTAVDTYLRSLDGVTGVHDLHIWGMSTTDVALTVHLTRPTLDDDDLFLRHVCATLRTRYGIAHATVQIERGHGPHDCELAPADVI